MLSFISTLTAWGDNITFADANVKAICVANWDTDGELSYEEAAAVTRLGSVLLGSVFKENTIISSFNQLPVGTIFTAEENGLQMQFRVTDAENFEVETYGTYEEGPAIDKQTEGEVVIPAEVNGYTVVGIGSWSFWACEKITSVSLPSTLTYIGESAFRTCYGLTEVEIPEGVTTIGNRAFFASLHKVILPSTLQEIGSDYTFRFSSADDNIVIVNNPVPLAINAGVFVWSGSRIPATLIVPLGSREAYQTADQWNGFKAIYDDPVSYTVNEMVGEQVMRTTKGYVNRGEQMTVPYHRYNVVDGVLYKHEATDKQYNIIATLTEDYENNLTYTATGQTDVVYLSEAEDIEGMTKCTSGNAQVRSSNAAAAYPADGDVEFVTLPAGIYELTAVMYNQHPTDSPYFDSDNPWTFLADGEPIATLTNDIVNFDEKTTEPFALTKETTLAIKQKGDSQIGLDLIYIVKTGDWQPDTTPAVEVTDISQMDNAIYIEPFTARAGDDVQIEVKLKNAEAATSYGFELVLPEGMTIAVNSDNEFDDELTLSSRNSKHSATTNLLTNGNYKIGVASMSSKAITGNDGTVLTITAHMSEDMAEGDYPIRIASPLLVGTDASKLAIQATQTRVTVEDYMKGDVDGDGVVDLADAVLVINYYVGKAVNTFVAKAADVDGDGTIDLADAVKIINFYVGKVPGLSRRATADGLDPQ